MSGKCSQNVVDVGAKHQSQQSLIYSRAGTSLERALKVIVCIKIVFISVSYKNEYFGDLLQR